MGSCMTKKKGETPSGPTPESRKKQPENEPVSLIANNNF